MTRVTTSGRRLFPPPTFATPKPSTPTEGAFDKLSRVDRKIARALFEAQQTGSRSGTPSGASHTPSKTFTLDEIAAMKQSGKGWGEIFKEMNTHGPVGEKPLRL